MCGAVLGLVGVWCCAYKDRHCHGLAHGERERIDGPLAVGVALGLAVVVVDGHAHAVVDGHADADRDGLVVAVGDRVVDDKRQPAALRDALANGSADAIALDDGLVDAVSDADADWLDERVSLGESVVRDDKVIERVGLGRADGRGKRDGHGEQAEHALELGRGDCVPLRVG